MKTLTAKFYRNHLGKEPVRDFLKLLHKEDRTCVGEDIKTVEFGWPIGMPVCRPLGGNLYEIRSSISDKREVRVLFFINKNYMFLLHAFIKKTQKTPINELTIARKRKQEVQNG